LFIDRLKALKGQRLDSIIISQPYHTLTNKPMLSAIRDLLHPEDGTVGFLWNRATLIEVSIIT